MRLLAPNPASDYERSTPRLRREARPADALTLRGACRFLLAAPDGTPQRPDVLFFNFGLHNINNKTLPGGPAWSGPNPGRAALSA